MTKRIGLNAFDMNCAGHLSPGLWRHADDRAWQYKTLEYWTDLAKLLERGKFDGIFIADVLGLYDVFGGNIDAALRNAVQLPVNDPLSLVAAIAQVTEHLGIGVTSATGVEHPFPFARRASTLDHLSNGRFGWNVVTGYLPSLARALGQGEQAAHGDRYDHADEYLEVTYKLWEGSWDSDAVVRDPAKGLFVDPSKVREINHHGEYFDVDAIHLSEPSPQRTPVIYQAGASPRGLQFAIENAEAIFTGSPNKRILAEHVKHIRDELDKRGRDRKSIKVYQMLTIIVDETSEKAHEKYAEYQRLASDEGALVLFSGWMGIDLSKYSLDEPIGNVDSNAIKSIVDAFSQEDESGKVWTVGDIAAWGGAVGSAQEVADELEAWIEQTDADGFNIPYAITPGSFADIVEHLIPELQRRGIYQTEYTPGTLRHKLFGAGDHLPADHRGARFRPVAATV